MLGDIASIATLILFVIYFIGRAITIGIEKNLCTEKISFEADQDIYNRYDIVEEVSTGDAPDSDADMRATIILTSTQGIWNIKIYQIAYDDDFNEIKKISKCIEAYDFLNIGQSYVIKTFVPEIIPRYRIEYRTQDMKKVTFDIAENLKNGVISELLVPKHTVKSLVYYLFR